MEGKGISGISLPTAPRLPRERGSSCQGEGGHGSRRGSPGTLHPPPPPSSEHRNPSGSGAPGSHARGYTSFPARAGFPAAASCSAKSREAGRPLHSPAPPAPYHPQPLTSSSSSTTCCSSSVIRAFFLSRALWAATRFFSFLRGRAAVSGRPCTHQVQPQPSHRCSPVTCATPSPPGSDA